MWQWIITIRAGDSICKFTRPVSQILVENNAKLTFRHSFSFLTSIFAFSSRIFSVVDYCFEIIQEYLVEVKHKADKVPVGTQGNHILLGSFTFTNGSLMMSTGQKLVVKLTGGMGKGVVVVRGESVKDTRDMFCCHIMADKLTRMNGMGIFGKSDPYLQISRCYDDGTFVVVYKTSHKLNDLKPKWNNTKIEIQKLCNGDLDAQLSVEMLDYQPDGQHRQIGFFRTTLREILAGRTYEQGSSKKSDLPMYLARKSCRKDLRADG